jgi:hypothetical protein
MTWWLLHRLKGRPGCLLLLLLWWLQAWVDGSNCRPGRHATILLLLLLLLTPLPPLQLVLMLLSFLQLLPLLALLDFMLSGGGQPAY